MERGGRGGRGTGMSNTERGVRGEREGVRGERVSLMVWSKAGVPGVIGFVCVCVRGGRGGVLSW